MNDNAILERLAKLEKSNRRLRVGLALCGVSLFSLVLVGAGFPGGNMAGGNPAVIKATEFQLVDMKGVVRGAFGIGGGAEADRASLTINDTAGKPRTAMGCDDQGSFIFVKDPDGNTRASMASVADQSYVNVMDPAGRTRMVMRYDNAGGPALRIKDEADNYPATLSASKQGAWLELHDDGGRSRMLATLADFVTEPPPPPPPAPAPAPGGLGPRQ